MNYIEVPLYVVHRFLQVIYGKISNKSTPALASKIVFQIFFIFLNLFLRTGRTAKCPYVAKNLKSATKNLK